MATPKPQKNNVINKIPANGILNNATSMNSISQCNDNINDICFYSSTWADHRDPLGVIKSNTGCYKNNT